MCRNRTLHVRIALVQLSTIYICAVFTKHLSVSHIIVRVQAVIVSGRDRHWYVFMYVCLLVSNTYYDQCTYSLHTS